MDFLALPRRDLQELCKRNGVRANMTNAAMADALRALPKVDGIEEYVKQPVPAPEPLVQAVVEEKNAVKQGNPLPRGRRAVAKSSEPVETEENNEEEKGNAKRQSSKEDAPPLGVGRRGASRRARPVPVVPQPAAVAEEETKRESKKDDAPAPIVGRRGASRRARPSPAMAAQGGESEVAGAEEEPREEVEDPKREAAMDDVPALGCRGVNRRARAAPSVAALGGKVAAEEQRDPIPRGRRAEANGSSAEPIMLDDSDDEEKEDAKPAEQQEDAQIVGVGRRGGAGRLAQAAPAVAAPGAKAEEEQRAPVPRGRRVKGNSTELIRLDDSKVEKKDDTKPEEERGDAPAIGALRRDASRRGPAPSEAPATRRNAAAGKSEAGDVAVEAVPTRATRQRKPTMKAAAAAEEKAPRRAIRRGELTSSLLQQEVHEEPNGQNGEAVGAPNMAVEAVPIQATRKRKPTMKAAAAATAEEKAPPKATRRGAVMRTVLQPEAEGEPQEVVGAPVSYQRCDALKEDSDAQKEQLNEMDAQKQAEGQDVVIIENEKLMEEIPAEEPFVTDQAQEEPQEPVGTLISYQRCDALEELEEASHPQKEELNEVDTAKHNKDQDVVFIEDEKLMEETPAEEASVTDQECTDNSEMQEQKVDDEKCHAHLATQEESPILGLVSTVIEQASEDQEGASFQDDESSSLGLLDKGACEHTCLAGEEMELVLGVQTLQAPLTGNESDANHENEMGNFNEVTTVREQISEVDTQEVSKEKEHADIAELHADIVDEAALLDCSSNVSQLAEEAINEKVNTAGEHTCLAGEEMEFVLGVQTLQASLTGNESDANHESEMENFNEATTVREHINEVDTQEVSKEKEHADIAELHADIVDEAAFLDCSSNVSQVAEEAINEKVNTAGEETNQEVNAEDGLGCQEEGDVVVDKVLHESVGNTILLDCSSWVEMEKAGHVPSEMPENTAALDEDGDKLSELVISDHMSQVTVTDEVVQEEKGVLITDDMLHGIAGMHDDIEDDQFETVFVQVDQVVTADNLLEEVTDDEVVEEMKTPLIVHEKLRNTAIINEDIVDDNFKTHVAHANEQKEVVAPNLPEVTGTNGEIEKTSLTVDEKKQSTVRINGDVVFDHIKTDTAHADEQKEVAAIVTEVLDNVWWAQEGGARKEIALLDDVTESVPKSIITMEPSVCKNSSEKKSVEPMAMLEAKGVKVASESEDLTKLSLGQLRAKLKAKLNAKKNKEANKRVALARVDENVCRSQTKGQHNLNLQHH